jgi:ATP-dependent exoDNAse (exonuclease V) beta subunit
MTAKLTFISAGAGSGKTHRLTSLLHEELSRKRVHPAGVIATTFTRKAATELRERVRGYLLKQGDHALANAMGQARIGTVNAVCGDLLRRFSFEAGMPAEQTVLEEEQTTLLLKQAIDMVQDGTEAAALVTLRSRLGIDDKDWAEDFEDLVAAVRANAIDPSALATMAQENADDVLGYFPKPAQEDLTKQLSDALDTAIPSIAAAAGSVQTTIKYLVAAEQLQRGLRHGDAPWSEWVRISKAEPAAALRPLVDDIKRIAARAPEHPQLHADMHDYLHRQFALCARVLDIYAEMKSDRAVIDFTDQERLLLQLLDHPFVTATLQEELDLLMVDEFQDTSPIQLALFLRLTQFAKQVVWVGDVKQAIYGFRGSDTELMQAILKELTAMGGTKERLDHSWRSRKPLVHLVNAAFVPAFTDSLTPEDIELHPQRTEALDDPPYGVWRLPGNVDQQVHALGAALRELVRSGYRIFDKPTKSIRPLRLGDIVILRKANDNVTKTALALRSVGIPAMTAQPGLLATPEAVLALACLRRLNDPGDTIASAEIISLGDCGEPEDWVIDRLAWLESGGDPTRWRESGDNPHPLLQRLTGLREELPVMSPAEALETVIADCQLPGIVLRWKPSADVGRVRLANLDTLVEMARQYETICEGARHAASVSGLLLWFDAQAAAKGDNLALPAIDAVQVMTHHKAKGLEWPVVILMDTHGDVKDALWDSLRAGSRQAITASDPLRDRMLRLWPWPFGKQKNLPLADEISRTAAGQAFRKIAIEESKRVLYVSMTRARDLMILAVPDKKPSGPWIETLDAPWLLPGVAENVITLPSGKTIPLLGMSVADDTATTHDQETLYWYHDPSSRQTRLPRIFNPSQAESPGMQILETAPIGQRLVVSGTDDWTTVGHAVHAAMALAFTDISRAVTVEEIESILAGYQLSAHVSASALADQIRAATHWVRSRWPSASSMPEWPIEAILENGQVLNGRIDLLLDLGDHWILLDHKSNPEKSSTWPELANTHGGQMLSYRHAIEAATGKPVRELWLVLPISAGAIRIEKASAE